MLTTQQQREVEAAAEINRTIAEVTFVYWTDVLDRNFLRALYGEEASSPYEY